MSRVLPYFKPLYPAITRRCNLCGVKITEDRYETELVRGVSAREAGGQYIFCEPCNEHIGVLTEKVGNLESTMDAEYEKIKQKKLRKFMEDEMDKLGLKVSREVSGSKPRQEGSSPPLRPSAPRTSRDTRTPGSIPSSPRER